jgi:obg-like ATPase 1
MQEILKAILAFLNEGKVVRRGEWKPDEIEVLNKHLLLTAKPVIYLVNMSEKDYARKKNKWCGHFPC